MNFWNILLWVLQGILAVIYLMTGFLKTFQTERMQEKLAWARRHSQNFVRFIGICELLGAFGLILPMLTGILPWLTPLAALGLALVQLLAVFYEHLPNKEADVVPMNLVLLALAAIVAVGRFFL